MSRVVLFCLLYACFLSAQATDPNLLQQAVTKHQAGDYTGAIEDYRQFLKEHPEAAPVRSNLGAALAHEGRFEDAIHEYRLALEADPKNTPVRLNLALAYYKSSLLADAIDNLEMVYQAEPKNQQALLLLATCYLRAGQNKKVIALLEPSAKPEIADPAFYYVFGMALMLDGQVDRGQLWLDSILRNGDSAAARLLMGTGKLMANDYPGARAEFLRAIELDPFMAEAQSYLGQTLLRSGDTGGAADAFRKELELDPNDFDANLQLGGLLRQDEKYDEARPLLERALKLRPRDPGARYQLASIDLLQGKVADARASLESLVKETPEFVEAHVSLATAYYREKRKADGDREREIVRSLNAAAQAKQVGGKAAGPAEAAPVVAVAEPPDFAQLSQQAQEAREANRPEAAGLLGRALKLNPAWKEGWWLLGTWEYQNDHYPECETDFQRLTALETKAGAGWAMLGLCRSGLKKYAAALDDLRQSLQLGISNEAIAEVARYHLAILATHAGRFEEALGALLTLAQAGKPKPEYLLLSGVAALWRPIFVADIQAADRDLVSLAGRAFWDAATRDAAAGQRSFEELLAKYPNAPGVHYLYGSYKLQDNPDLAVPEFEQELKISPKHVGALAALAAEYLRRGEPQKGLPYAKRTAELLPDAPGPHVVLGRILTESGDLKAGLSELEKARQLGPQDPAARIALASVYAKLGRNNDAARERREFLRLKQEHKEAGEQ